MPRFFYKKSGKAKCFGTANIIKEITHKGNFEISVFFFCFFFSNCKQTTIVKLQASANIQL